MTRFLPKPQSGNWLSVLSVLLPFRVIFLRCNCHGGNGSCSERDAALFSFLFINQRRKRSRDHALLYTTATMIFDNRQGDSTSKLGGSTGKLRTF